MIKKLFLSILCSAIFVFVVAGNAKIISIRLWMMIDNKILLFTPAPVRFCHRDILQ